jgi:CD2 antigen cytoplasmic tail-binding protein 2
VKFEFKWDVTQTAEQMGQAFGPFSEDEMKVWFKAAYFGTDGEKVRIREVCGEWGDWADVMI